jgi:hypothetical protein
VSLSEKHKSMNEAAALRFVYEPNAAKHIARDFGVSVAAAKLWLAGRFPLARRQELAARIQARLDERDALAAEIRRQWAGGSDGEAAGSVDRRRLVEDRPPADPLGTMTS